MPDRKNDSEMELGVFGRPAGRSLGAAETIALVLSGLWLGACIVFFLVLGGTDPEAPDALRFVMVLLAVALPVAVIWLAASAARSARVMREESGRLQAALTAMRQSFLEAQHAHVLGPRPADLTQKLEEIAEKQKQTESALATFVSSRPRLENRLASPATTAPREISRTDAETGQASLALGTPLEALAAPVEIDDVIRAVNFPENAEDEEGFAALRRALGDRKVASLIQAAQDVLTLLSQDGIYMDDLRPDRARPEIWRQFALGTRGRTIAALGGVRDRSSLALSAGRMRHDPVFRDAVHHFLRRFDEMLTSVEPRMSDEEIARLGDTRTARAFMLLGRVTHTFD
jgi:type II secretory pathway pseudopilin PulG